MNVPIDKQVLYENVARNKSKWEMEPGLIRGDTTAKYVVHNERTGLWMFTQDKPDLKNRPTNEDTRALCNIGQGSKTCRYLTADEAGWSCQKFGYFRDHLDDRVWRSIMGIAGDAYIHAQGDNCAGKAQ